MHRSAYVNFGLTIFFINALFLFNPSHAFATSPSDVTNLRLWLDANDSSTLFSDVSCTTLIPGIDGNQVACWKDKSTYGDNVFQSTASARPLYRPFTDVFAGKPSLDFDSINDTLTKDITDWSASSTLFMVLSSDSATPSEFEAFFSNNNVVLTNGSYQVDYASSENKFRFLMGSNSNSAAFVNYFGAFESQVAKLYSVRLGDTLTELFSDGALVASGANSLVGSYSWYRINQNRTGNKFHDSHIAEVIVYDRALSDCEVEEVNSYLSTKYGNDFSGFAAAYTFTDYTSDIDAIGRKTAACGSVEQRDTATSTTLVVSNPSDNTNDDEYFAFANNGASGGALSSSVPGTIQKRLSRAWRAARTSGFTGTVDLKFDISDTGLTDAGGVTYRLLTDADGDFSNATIESGTGTYASGVVTFPSVSITDGEYFTLAIQDTTNPSISTLTPADNATDVATSTNFTVVFNEPVVVGSGNILIKKTSNDIVVATTSVSSVSGSGTNAITFTLADPLMYYAGYSVLIDGTAFDDIAGNSFAGISATTTWNFTTGLPSDPALDSDGDGISDWTEYTNGSDPFDADDPIINGDSDADGDGVPDGVEQELCDQYPALASCIALTVSYDSESDGDGITDVTEFNTGSDPTDPDSPYVDGDADTDSDGVKDGFESAICTMYPSLSTCTGTIPSTGISLTSDADGDGVSDVNEFRLGTDPGVAPSEAHEESLNTSSRRSSGGIHYGCKDPLASNYEYFSRHKQELCQYDITFDTQQSGSVCAPHITNYIRYGGSNNSEDVKKLEQFLNDKQGESLPVDGIYSLEDVEAVKRFQKKYSGEILTVWGLTEPTGYVYRTTLMKINSFYCSQNVTCPYFTEYNNTTENNNTEEVARTKTLLTELGFYSGTINNTFDTSLKSSLRTFQETFSDAMLKPWGLLYGTGYKYKTTNKFLNMLVGCETGAVELDGKGAFDY